MYNKPREADLGDLSWSTGHEAGSPCKPHLRWTSQISCPVQFIAGWDPLSALFDPGSEVNAIILGYAQKLGLEVRFIDVGARKIDGTNLKTHGMNEGVLSVADRRQGKVSSSTMNNLRKSWQTAERSDCNKRNVHWYMYCGSSCAESLSCSISARGSM